MAAAVSADSMPMAFFVGDFNTGKSTIINALLREPVLRVERHESHALPTLVYRGGQAAAQFGALPPDYKHLHRKSLSQFQAIRDDETNTVGYRALAAQTPSCPFSRLTLVDTAGASSDRDGSAPPEFGAVRHGLMVVVTDIEYWSSKHNLDLIASYRDAFGDALVVVANKTDHLNMSEIDRVCKKAAQRMEEYGITPAPRFFALSGRLEALRGDRADEYRRRTKPSVRAHCDAAFDAFRLALFEFESACLGAAAVEELDLFKAPLAQSVIRRSGDVPAAAMMNNGQDDGHEV